VIGTCKNEVKQNAEKLSILDEEKGWEFVGINIEGCLINIADTINYS